MSLAAEKSSAANLAVRVRSGESAASEGGLTSLPKDAAIVLPFPSDAIRTAFDGPMSGPAVLRRVTSLAQQPRSLFKASTGILDGRWKDLAERTRAPNWGCENEQAIAHEDWQWAKDFSERPQWVIRPSPAPCGDGSVHLTWYGKNKSRLVIEHKGTRICFSLRDASGTYSGGEVPESRAIDLVRTFLG